MDVKQGELSVHPLDYLTTSNKDISTIEYRDFLNRQEMSLEKSLRIQSNTNESLKEYIDIQRLKANSILENNSLNDSLINGIETIGYNLYGINDGILEGFKDVNLQLQFNRDTNIHGFNHICNELFNIGEINKDGFDKIISGISSLSRIVYEVHESLNSIDLNISNPEKALLLERKRDGFEYYKNGWIEDSLDILNKALEIRKSDYDIHYLKGIIFLEEFKNYEESIKSFKKAIKYSEPYDEVKYSAALSKLSLCYYIVGDFESAYKGQIEALKYDKKALYWFYLARYSVILGNKITFEKSIYECLIYDNSFIVNILNEECFVTDSYYINVIQKIFNEVYNTPIIITIFNNILNREPKPEELSYYIEMTYEGKTKEELEEYLKTSFEYFKNNEYINVKNIFEEFLFRKPKIQEYEYYLTKMYEGTDVNNIINEIKNSDEYLKLSNIFNLYKKLLDRLPDKTELRKYINEDIIEISKKIKKGNEYKTKKEHKRILNGLNRDKFFCIKETIKILESNRDIYFLLQNQIKNIKKIINQKTINHREVVKFIMDNHTVVYINNNMVQYVKAEHMENIKEYYFSRSDLKVNNKNLLDIINQILLKYYEKFKTIEIPSLPKKWEESDELLERFSHLSKIIIKDTSFFYNNDPGVWSTKLKEYITLRDNSIYFKKGGFEIELFDYEYKNFYKDIKDYLFNLIKKYYFFGFLLTKDGLSEKFRNAYKNDNKKDIEIMSKSYTLLFDDLPNILENQHFFVIKEFISCFPTGYREDYLRKFLGIKGIYLIGGTIIDYGEGECYSVEIGRGGQYRKINIENKDIKIRLKKT